MAIIYSRSPTKYLKQISNCAQKREEDDGVIGILLSLSIDFTWAKI